jgi:hypothetical protein
MFILGEDACVSSACWRGYIGVWKIIDDKLYLTELRSCCYKEDKITGDLNEIFGERCQNGKVLADWYTGEIIIPRRKMLYYEHMGYGSVFKKELSLKISNGSLEEVNKYDNSKTRISYLNSNKLTKIVIRNMSEELLNSINNELKVYVDVKSTNRVVDSVKIVRTNKPELSAELIRIISAIEDWDILYQHGKPIEMNWYYPVIINNENIRKYSR